MHNEGLQQDNKPLFILETVYVLNKRECFPKCSQCFDEVAWEEISGELVKKRNQNSDNTCGIPLCLLGY